MGGFAAIAPMGTIDLDLADRQPHVHNHQAPYLGCPARLHHPSARTTGFWLGLGLFSRFGLGNEFADNWTGRYNLTNINFQTFSLVPTVALKVNDVLSLSAGVEIMHASFAMGQQIPSMQYIGYIPSRGEDSKMTLNGTGWGVGAQVGAHLRMTDELSLGFSHKSPVTLNIAGSADFSRHHSNMLADQGQVPHTIDTDVHSTVHLPDSFAVGLAYRPLENLSFEVGTVFTRWSTYDSMNIYFDSDFQSINHKKWRDGWNFNASVEYEPLDWLALRAGIWYDDAGHQRGARGLHGPQPRPHGRQCGRGLPGGATGRSTSPGLCPSSGAQPGAVRSRCLRRPTVRGECRRGEQPEHGGQYLSRRPSATRSKVRDGPSGMPAMTLPEGRAGPEGRHARQPLWLHETGLLHVKDKTAGSGMTWPARGGHRNGTQCDKKEREAEPPFFCPVMGWGIRFPQVPGLSVNRPGGTHLPLGPAGGQMMGKRAVAR